MFWLCLILETSVALRCGPWPPARQRGTKKGPRANPGAGTCTFSGHRHLSATNAPGRRHVATPRAHCTKVMSRLRLILAAGSQPDTRAALQLADRTTFHRREPCTSHSPPARPWGASASLLVRPARHLFILLISPEQSPPPLTGRARAPPPHPARCRRPRPWCQPPQQNDA